MDTKQRNNNSLLEFLECFLDFLRGLGDSIKSLGNKVSNIINMTNYQEDETSKVQINDIRNAFMLDQIRNPGKHARYMKGRDCTGYRS